MELQGEDGSIVELSETQKKELGRGPGIAAHDRSVSRRQVRLQVQRIAGHFVVINVVGPNPICVIHATTGGDVEVEVVKSGSQSSLNIGDKFSLSIQAPVFYTLSAKRPHRSVQESTDRGKLVVEDDQQGVVEGDEEEGIAVAVARWQRRKQERLQSDQRRSSTDEGEAQQAQHVSQQELVYSQAVSHEVHEPEQAERPTTSEADTDVAKKFGIIVEGSEFERYGRKGLDTSKWNWRIGRQSDNDDDDDDVEKRRGLFPNPKQKAKSRDEEDDDDWRGDSEGEKELISARKRPSLRKKDVQTRSHNSATTSDTRVDPRKKRKLDSTSGLENASVEQGKTKLSRQATPSTSTKKSSKRQSRVTKDEDEEEDDDGEDLDGFLVDDVDEEDEEVADDEDDEWTDEDEEVEEEDEIDEDPSGARAPGRHGKDKGDVGDDKPLCKYGNKCFRKNKDHLAEFRH